MTSLIFKRFKDLSVISKLLDEMEKSLDIRDKVLAEFVLALAKKSKTVMEFEKQLEQNGAEFSIDLISNMYALITKMLPECFPRSHTKFKAVVTEDDPIAFADAMTGEHLNEKERKRDLAHMFPSLA